MDKTLILNIATVLINILIAGGTLYHVSLQTKESKRQNNNLLAERRLKHYSELNECVSYFIQLAESQNTFITPELTRQIQEKKDDFARIYSESQALFGEELYNIETLIAKELETIEETASDFELKFFKTENVTITKLMSDCKKIYDKSIKFS